VFLVTVLGASAATVGMLEGIAEATAAITKVFSGALSDRWQRRKSLIVAGYGLAALTKPLFPLAESVSWVLTARFLDRVGKGIRGAPRDALITDITPAEVRGRSFGLRQALDTVGAIGGPLLALAAMAYFSGNFHAAFWIAVVPAMLAVLLIVIGVDEPDRTRSPATTKSSVLSMADIRRLPRNYFFVVTIAGVLTLARFSEAFLVLRAQNVGFPNALAPLVMVVMSIVYAATSYPAGAAADRGHGPRLLSAGLLALFAADLVLAHAAGRWTVLVGATLWGLHMGLTQGLLSALVAGSAPANMRGTAFGVFNLVCGIALLIASGLAGWLWDAFGPRFTFYAGATFTVIAWIGFLRYGRRAAALPSP